jgi:hypothetical protein
MAMPKTRRLRGSPSSAAIRSTAIQSAAILAAVIAAVIAAPGAAQTFELPAATWIDHPAAVVVALDGAVVEVVREPTSKPALRARVRSESEDGEKPTLQVVRGESLVEIRRGDSGGVAIVVELILDSQQPLRIAGSGLEITVAGTGAIPPPGGESGETGESGEPVPVAATQAAAVAMSKLDLQVEGSTVQLTGVSGATVVAVDSSLFVAATESLLSLRLDGGDAEIRGHQGRIEYRGVRADAWLADLDGSVDFAIEGGSFRMSDSRGNATGNADGGLVSLDGWFGPLKLAGSDATVELRAAEGSRSNVDLRGSGLDATVAGLAGMLTAEVHGGRLQINEKLGNTRIQASEGAEVRIDRAGGNTVLSLQQSSATLTDVRAPQVRVDLRDGRLDGDRIHQLELVAERAEVRVSGLEELARAEVVDTRLELDLRGLARTPTLTLRGASEALLRLATPCAVELSNAQLVSDRIDVTGCELFGEGTRRGRSRVRGVEGNSVLTLTATVDEDSHLEVEGYP